MTTTTIHRQAEQQELPALTTSDRVALTIGTHLILRAERAARTEQARITRAAHRAERANESTFEHRALAGPRW